jgi:FkbM family methyltransferase
MEVYRYGDLGDPAQVDLGMQRTMTFLGNVFNPPSPHLWATLFNSAFGPMVLNLRDKGVSGDIMQTGSFEPNQIGLLSDIVRFLLTRQRNLIVYDVGANLGTHTLALAKINPSRVRVRSFEVQSKVFYMLCGSVALNGLGNVDCHHLAVGDKDGRDIDVNIPDYSGTYNYGGFEVETIKESDNQDMAKPHSERVRMATLDSFGEFVDMLKIDVEGMEEKVLAGACNIFEASMPVCFIEVFKSNVENLITFFKSRGYIGYSSNQDLLAIPSKLDLQVNGLQRVF